VVLFDLEEVGLLGSRAYVAAGATDRMAAMVNVDIASLGDMLAYGPTTHEGNDEVYRGFKTVCAVQLVPCGSVVVSGRPPSRHSREVPMTRTVLFLMLLLTGCGSRPPAASVPAPMDRAEAEPGIEWTQVPSELGEALRDSLRFGYLAVPADHGEPDGARIRLAVGILPARTATPAPDPVVFITGGPGANGIELFAQRFAESHDWDRLRERRDLVILDPRGHGYSDPRLPRGPLQSDYRLCDEFGPAGAAAPESVQVSSRRRVPASAAGERCAAGDPELRTGGT
jgi:hypothetical protein